MAVAFDAVASATGFTTTTPSTTPWLTWTHTAGTGGGTVIVGLAWGSTSFPPTITSITYGGNAMSSLGSIAANNTSGNGGVLLYGITGQASGANAVLVKTSGNPSNVMIGNSVSFTGAAGFGTAVTNSGSSASASVTVTGTTSGNLVVSVEAHGTNGAVTYTAGTKRFDDEVSAATGASNLSGGTIAAGGSVSLTDTITSDTWGVVGVEVQAPAAAPPPVPPAMPGRTWWRQFKHPQQLPQPAPPAAVTGPAGNPPGGRVVYRRPARSIWGGVLAQPGQPLINGTAPPHLVIARRSAARAVWRGSLTATVNATPGQAVNGTAPLHLVIARRAAARAVWRGLAVAPRLAGAATGGLVRRRNAVRAVWAGTTTRTVNASAPPPAGQQPHGFTSSRRPVGGLWGGLYTPQGNASGPSGQVQPKTVVARRMPARAVWRGTPAGTSNAAPAAPVNGTVQPAATAPHRPHAAQRVLWRGNPVPGQQPHAATGGVTRRRAPARGQWHGNAGPAAPAAPGVPVTGGRVTRRPPARGQWRGTTARTVNASGPGVSAPRMRPRVTGRAAARGWWHGTLVSTANQTIIPARQGTVTVTAGLANTIAITDTITGTVAIAAGLAGTVTIRNTP